MKPEEVKPGDILYVQSSYYIGHGEDDITGGKATVDRVEITEFLPEDHCNRYMVVFKEIPRIKYNLRGLLEIQKELKNRFKNGWAHPDPDYRSL